MRTKVIQILTGKVFKDIDEILKDEIALRNLWLEILFNDEIIWENFLDNPVVKQHYEKACEYYKSFGYLLDRKPLLCKGIERKEKNFPEYRKFEEVYLLLS